MLEKITELANKEKKISDFHLRGGSNIAYRILGEIAIEPESKIEEKDLDELLKKNCGENEIKVKGGTPSIDNDTGRIMYD